MPKRLADYIHKGADDETIAGAALGMTAATLDTLAPGVLGYTVLEAGELWIPYIRAIRPGTGQVAAYLDSLPTDVTVVFPTVLSSRLARMLVRRGFWREGRWIEEAGEWIEVYVRHAP